MPYNFVPNVILSLSLFAALVSAESYFGRKKRLKLYTWKNSLAGLGILAGNLVVTTLVNEFVFFPALVKVHSYALWEIGPRFADGAAAFFTPSFFALVLLDDFTYYVHHRVFHKFDFLWAVHETHHTSRVYNVLVAARVPWIDLFSFIFWLPLTLLGFDPMTVLFQHTLNMTWNLLLHTRLIDKMGFLESFMNTPSHHRVHHGINDRYIDKNFACIFIIWDKLFGTFEPESEPSMFGTLPQMESESVFKIAFHGLMHFYRRPKSLREAETQESTERPSKAG